MRAYRVLNGVMWLAVAAAAAGCGGANGVASTTEVASVQISPPSASLKIGGTLQLAAAALTAGGEQISGAIVAFSSSDASVATSTTGGLVSAIAPGTATITARSGSAAGSATVTVLPPEPASLQLSVDSVDMAASASTAVTTTVKDASGAVLPNVSVTYTSSDTSVFTVNSTGVISARNSGVARLTATASAARDSVPVVVFRAFRGTLQAPVAVPGRPFGVTVSPQGVAYVTEQDGNALSRITLPSLTSAGSVPVGPDPGEVIFTASGPLNGMVLSHDGKHVYVSNTLGGIAELDATTNALLRIIPLSGTLQDIDISPDGTELYVAVEGKGFDVVNVATGAVSASITLNSAFGLRVSPQGYYVAVGDPSTGHVFVYDRVLRRLVAQFSVSGIVRRLAFDSGDTTLAVASESNALYVMR